MKDLLKYIYIFAGLLIVGAFTRSAWYGKALWESNVQHNTEYTGKRVYGGYGNRLNHK
ncbi:hypothetical protein LPB86_19855 [Pedobacter sp. MC2016-14]|uniref:hypothetical protein n=1 Tax=Pedobacter sp. MC2016-14 TaxID=2897327 RepID=UPI001E62759B|nr:hypothetical protein [Pedobacter sp. MC2016-14]MCD0490504.1 hypothetical protein [Pedobacter sp. MC2016-14]